MPEQRNDRIFVNTNYMADSAVVSWAAASDGIMSRHDLPDYDGEIMILLDGQAMIKFWENDECFVLVLDPKRRSGSYVTVYMSEDQPPDPDAEIAWSPSRPFGSAGHSYLSFPCPVYGEARTPQECEKCGGNIEICPVYGPAERRRQAEDPGLRSW